LNILVFAVVLTEDRNSAAQELAAHFGITAEQMLTMPHFLIGTQDKICRTLQAHRERYGISYISIFENNLEVFAPIVARMTGQ